MIMFARHASYCSSIPLVYFFLSTQLTALYIKAKHSLESSAREELGMVQTSLCTLVCTQVYTYVRVKWQ